MAATEDKRYFENNLFDEKEIDKCINSDGKLCGEVTSKIQNNIDYLLDRLHKGISETKFSNNGIYTGRSGISFLYLHLLRSAENDSHNHSKYLKRAQKYLGEVDHRRVTFLSGDAGILALKAHINHILGNTSIVSECIQMLEGLYKTVRDDRDLPCEVLFGQAGYLYSLLYLRRYLGPHAISSSVIQSVTEQIISCGRDLAQSEHSKFPLMYEWHDRHYLGAAHGLAGIFTVLLQVNESGCRGSIEKYVRPSIDAMIPLMFKSGNCPSSVESGEKDKLVHWCHGAPGWVHMFATAYRIFGDKKYLREAERCSEAIWQRGLLKKGYGLCHGTAGNAYAFLTLYQLTKHRNYLYKAYKFAEWCFDYGKHGCRTPDTPYSLFEGMAGTIYFLIDLLNPVEASFPAFILPP